MHRTTGRRALTAADHLPRASTPRRRQGSARLRIADLLSRVGSSRPGWALGQALIVLAGVVVYFGVRGQTEGAVATAVDHAHDIVALERELGIDIEGVVQGPVEASSALEAVVNWIYIWGHWPVIIVTMIWLLWGHRDVFLRLRDAMLISGGVGMVIFATYPVAPPRLADLGLVDTVTQSSYAYRVLQPPAFVNQYAAVPSLHAGWDLLIGMAIVSAATTAWLRLVGAAMPVLMAFAVVATANHYVLDVVAGIALVLVAHLGALALERRRRRRRAGRPRPVSAAVPAPRDDSDGADRTADRTVDRTADRAPDAAPDGRPCPPPRAEPQR